MHQYPSIFVVDITPKSSELADSLGATSHSKANFFSRRPTIDASVSKSESDARKTAEAGEFYRRL